MTRWPDQARPSVGCAAAVALDPAATVDRDEEGGTRDERRTCRSSSLVALAARLRARSPSSSARSSGPKRYNRAKLDAYECGIEPTPQPVGGGRFPVKYYLTAMLFIIFDIEIVFLYPWAVALRRARRVRAGRDGAVHRHRLRRLRLRLAARRAGLGLRGTEQWVSKRSFPSGVLLTTRREAGRTGRARRSLWPATFGLACCAIEMMATGGAALRPGPVRHGGLPRLAAPGRPDDRRRPGEPEDGPGAAPDLRPDGRAEVGDLDGRLRRPAAACSTTTRSCRASTTSCRSTCTCPAARRARRCCIDAILKLHEQDPARAARRQPRAAARAPSRMRSATADRRRSNGPAMTATHADDEAPTRRRRPGSGRSADRDRRAPRRRAATPAEPPTDGGPRPSTARARHVRCRAAPATPPASAAWSAAVQLPGEPRRGPYGGYFDEVADALARLPIPAFDRSAVEQVVVDRGELTLLRRAASTWSRSCRRAARRPGAALRAVLIGAPVCDYPRDDRPRAARRSTTCSR